MFYKYHTLTGKVRPGALAILLILIVAAGFASWRLIEEPFRRRTLLATMAGLALPVGGIQTAALVTDGAPGRYSRRALVIMRYAADAQMVEPPAKCFLTQRETIGAFGRARCLAPRPGAPSWLLVGDSHAAMFFHGLRSAFPQVNLQAVVGHGCDLRLHAVPSGRLCDDLAHLVYTDYLPTARLAGVIVTGRSEAFHVEDLRELGARLRARGQRLVVIGPAPGYTMPVSRVLAEIVERNDPALAVRLIEPRVWAADAALRAAAQDGAFAYVSPMAVLCPGNRSCRLANANGMPLYFDGDHYTPEGSLTAVAALIRAGAFDGTGLVPENDTPRR